ncbi:hypothetical protein HYV84_06300 [Candidatus Woesearchaeota archaeon]|nr:hypothetical protein [Candidatus Woesearchaeota archaeon]
MKRVMPDTNIYEFILRFVEKKVFEQALLGGSIVFYGNAIIRKELREIPKVEQQIVEGKMKSLRNALLSLYDSMVGKHHYEITSQMEELAGKYFTVFKELGGNAPWKELAADLTIVACASLHNLNLLVTEDAKTMTSDIALKSYRSVNKLFGFSTPSFIRFQEFKNLLRGGKLD